MGVQGSGGLAELTWGQTEACGLEKTRSSFLSQDREDELAEDIQVLIWLMTKPMLTAM